MGGFYGYDPGNYVPDSSHWERMFGQAAQTILQIPQVLETQKALEEGRETNSSIYEGLKTEIGGMKDEDVKTYFGYDKASLLKMVKPGRNEGLEYFPRFAKITGEGLKSVYAMKNLENTVSTIENINSNGNTANEVSNMGILGELKKGGNDGVVSQSTEMKPITSYASPEQIQRIARRNNVPIDKLQPEMSQATNRRDAQQMRQIDFDKSAGENIANIGGQGQGIGENTMKAIATTQTKGQQEASKIDAFNAGTNRIKAENDTKAENRKLLEIDNVNYDNNMSIRNSLVREMSSLQTQLKEANNEVNLDPPLGATDDEKKEWQKKHKAALGNQIKIVSEIESLQGNLENIDKKIGEYIKVDLSRKGYSAGTVEDVATFVTGRDPGETIDFTAQGLLNYGQNLEQKNGIQLGLNYEGMVQALKNGTNIAEMIYRIRKRAGMER